MNSSGYSGPKPSIIAHRGASAHAPENTMVAFLKAADLGADMVELDVHLSSDGALMVMHDTTVDRTTSATGRVWRRSGAELKALDAGSWFSAEFAGEGVPALAEVFRALPQAVGVNVEVKSPGDGDERTRADLAEALLEELSLFGAEHDVIISSFDYGLLEEIGLRQPRLALAYLYSMPEAQGTLTARMASGLLRAIHPYHLPVTEELVAEAHGLGVSVNAWTVDSPEDMWRLCRLGVDGIITNVPEVALEVRSRAGAIPQASLGVEQYDD